MTSYPPPQYYPPIPQEPKQKTRRTLVIVVATFLLVGFGTIGALVVTQEPVRGIPSGPTITGPVGVSGTYK